MDNKAGGRPQKNIDKTQFESLCGLQCTLDEMCGWFDCCSDTLESWCKRTYSKGFSEVFKEKRGRGKISLRRAQFRLAQKNANMAIWLGKQYLGQSDHASMDVAITEKEDGLSKSLREFAKGLESDE